MSILFLFKKVTSSECERHRAAVVFEVNNYNNNWSKNIHLFKLTFIFLSLGALLSLVTDTNPLSQAKSVENRLLILLLFSGVLAGSNFPKFSRF